MKSIKTMLLVVCAAIAAMAVPALASAAEWTKDHQQLSKAAAVDFTGEFTLLQFDYNGDNEIGCHASGEATLSPGDEGTIEGLEYDLEACWGTGLLEGCEVESAELGAPISLRGNEAGSEIAIEGYSVEAAFGNCAIDEATTEADLTATPDDPRRISTLYSSGEGTVNMLGQQMESDVGAILYLSPAGTYGIQDPVEWWTEEGNPISGPQTIQLDGLVGITLGWGTIECKVEGEAILSIYGGEIAEFAFGDCEGWGAMGECTLQSSASEAPLPWAIEPGGSAIAVPEVGWDLDCGSSWPGPMTGDLTLTPDDNEAISSLDVFGSMEGVNVSFGEAFPFGELEVSPAGTYGIQE